MAAKDLGKEFAKLGPSAAWDEAFHRLGGVAGLRAWAAENPTEFYRLYSKRIRAEVDITSGGKTLSELLEEASKIAVSNLPPSAAPIALVREADVIGIREPEPVIVPEPEDVKKIAYMHKGEVHLKDASEICGTCGRSDVHVFPTKGGFFCRECFMKV